MNKLRRIRRIDIIRFIVIVFLFSNNLIFAQSEQIRILAYNLLEYTNSSGRDTSYRTIFSSINPSPDIIAACEIADNSATSAQYFLSNVLNYSSNLYNMGTFIPNGSHADINIVYYKPSKFTFLSSQLIIGESGTINHPTYEYQLYNNLTGDKIIIFGVHYPSGGITARSTCASTIRSYSNALPSDSYFIAAGDFNLVLGGAETGYTNLLSGTSGNFVDPLSLSGDWTSNPNNYPYQTYSTRTTSFGGGGGGGLQYRFDLILNSQTIVNNGGITYLGSGNSTPYYTTYGNDSLHYKLSVNDTGSTHQPNQVVSQQVADALYSASDHLPVFADYTFAIPSTINPPYQGSIAFTQVGVSDGSNPDEIEFVTLYRMDLTKLKITNSPVQNDNTLGTVVGGGTYDLGNTDWTDVPAGTHVRLGPNLSNENLSTGLSDGILTYNGSGSSTLPSFSLSGDNQVIAYTGLSSSPTYIAGLHWGGTSGVWPDPSYAPGTSSDLALGTNNYYYFSGTLTGTLYTDRNNLIDPSNWTGSPTWIDYQSQPLPVELSSFTGKISNGVTKLNWRTETEINNYGFEIQRSSDKINWSKIGFVPGNGNSNSPKEYSFVDKLVPTGNNYYRLKQKDTDGKFEYSGIIEVYNDVSTDVELSQNYPNPFNPVSIIQYTISTNSFVSLKVYDLLGREVTTLVYKKQNAGRYSVNFNGSGLASGIYIYVLKTDNIILSKKMSLLK